MYTMSDSRLDYQTIDHVCGLAVFYHTCGTCFVDEDGHDPTNLNYTLHADITFENISDVEVDLIEQEAKAAFGAEEAASGAG